MRRSGKIFLPPPQNIILNYLTIVGNAVYADNKIIEPFIGQFIKEGVFAFPGDKDYDYDRFVKS
jgi:hypothetical protein